MAEQFLLAPFLDVKLDTEQIVLLDNVSALPMGYPPELLSTVQRQY